MACDTTLERRLVAYVLGAPRSIRRIGGLRPEHLADADARRALTAAQSLAAENARPDEAAVVARMRDQGHGDALKAVQRVKGAGALAGGIGEASVILRDMASVRAVREPLMEALALAEDGDVEAAKERARLFVDAMIASDAEETGATSYTSREAALEVLEEVRRRAERPPMRLGPFTPLARHFQAGDLVVIGGETNAGKSQLGLLLGLRWNAATGQKCGIVSTEDRAYVYGDRLIAGITNHSLLSGELTEDAFSNAERAIHTLGDEEPAHLEILDDHDLGSVERAMAKCVRQGCGVLVVDYLQTITATMPNKQAANHERVEQIVRRVKAQGKRLRVPVLLVSQLARPANRQHREPSLFELKGSGYIEQAATAIVLVWKTADDGDTLAKIAKLKSGGERPTVTLQRNDGGMITRIAEYAEPTGAAGGVTRIDEFRDGVRG